MNLALNEKEKRSISSIVQERIDEHLSRFPFSRYPVEPLDAWKRDFCDPKAVSADTLSQALGWHFGSWQWKDIPIAQKKTIIHIIKAWPEYAESSAFEPAQSLSFWQQKLTDWQHGFNAVSFLLHLTRPDSIEIADHHRLQAMTELLKEINHQDGDRTLSRSLLDLEYYTDFFRAVMPKLPFGQRNRIQLDRFLKAYGNRHAYKNIPIDYRTKEPEIKHFSWSDCKAERFDLSKIKLRSNADILFAALLLALDKQQITEDNFTIGQVAERIPLGTAGICNPASYNYAMVALFGRQKGRDYLQLESPSLREAFTEQANQSTRNMKFYILHADQCVTINPKYQKQK